jgi:hypothetical protein
MANYLSVHIITGLDEKTLPLDEPNEVIAFSHAEVQLFHIPNNNKHIDSVHISLEKASFGLPYLLLVTYNYDSSDSICP